MTIQTSIQVDYLTDYSEMGAHPTAQNYELDLYADVNFETLELSNIEILDTARNAAVTYNTLTDRDRARIYSVLKEEAAKVEVEIYDDRY